MLKNHLSYIASTYKTFLPEEKVPMFKTGVCLTFDDATFDFYHFIYPLLKSLNLKAVLAVCPAYIIDKTNLLPSIRLSCEDAFKQDLEKAPFCTWEELKEMVNSPFVEIASHSYSHIDLSKSHIDLNQEIIGSKNILEKKLRVPINTFVYPYGKFTKDVHNLVKQNYSTIMRIGSSINLSWNNFNKLHYRIPSDQLKSYKEPFTSYIPYFLKYFSNSFLQK